MIDYWLGGVHHRPVDVRRVRVGVRAVCRDLPALRAFSGRAVRRAVGDGTGQFLVFGAGIPTQANVHETAPAARVLYTDVDPQIVFAGRQLLARLENVNTSLAMSRIWTASPEPS